MADSRLGNFQSCCRLCLCEKLDTLKSVFDETAEDRSLPQKILQFVAIEITTSDKVTTMVCDQCTTKVNQWHEYKQECFENQSKLDQWFNSCSTMNGIGDISLQIKEEPAEEPTGEGDENMSEPPDHAIAEVLVKNEPMEQSEEPMEEEYNELPPPLTPHPLDSNVDSENSQDSGTTPGTTNNRQCTICNKLFSSSGNRRKHEKQIHGKHQPGADIGRRSQMNTGSLTTSYDASANAVNQQDGFQNTEEPQENAEPPSETEQQKIQFAAGLKLLQKNATPISCEPLSKIEISYIEKCKAMALMHKSLECACHKVAHPNLKGLLSHLRALRIWFPVFTCYNCMITFTDRSTFTKHNVRCPKTSLETIIKLSNLKKRSEVKTRLYQNFKCTSCKFMFSFHDDYCKHVDEEHVANEPPVMCTCGRHFDNMEDFKDHVYVSCLVEYYCDICFITTKTLDAFQKHAMEVHDNSEGFILLQDDNYKMRKPFHHKDNSDENVIVTGKRERRMSIKTPILEPDDDEDMPRKVINPAILSANSRECPLCGKEYSSHNNMIRHYKTHLEVTTRPVEATDDSFYSCPECGGMYNSNEWQVHLTEKHEPKTCGECGKIFQFQSELDQHRSVHLNLKVYRDSKTQSYKTTMISPVSEGGEVMLMCEVCDVMFTTKEDLKEHKLTHDGNIPMLESPKEESEAETKESRYSCKPCNKQYSSYGGIWDHNKKKHPEKKTPFTDEWPKQCKECDKVCATGAAYYRHKQIHEKDRINTDNGEAMPTKMPMMKPKREAGTEDDEESYHTCKRCFKVFSSRYNLKNHMKSHGINISPTNKKIVKKVWCDICHQSFVNNEVLATHKEEHGGDEMPQLTNQVEGLDNKVPFIFTCDVCVMTFTTKMALKKHKEKHALEQKSIGQKPGQVYCKYCKIAFDSVTLLTKHMHLEHDETSKPKINKIKEKPRQFVCSICKKNFMTSSALSTHMGWHKRSPNTGDSSKPAKVLKQNKVIAKLANNLKPKQEPIDTPEYQCATCLAEFPNDTALQVHILEKHRSVSAIMLIPRCNTCNKDFSNQDEYETHKRFHEYLERQKQHDKMLLQQQEAEEQAGPEQSTSTKDQQKPLALPPSSTQGKFFKGFPCKYCNAAFSRADTLSGHIRQFHKEYVQNEFKCTQCDRVFDKQNSLSIHLKVHEKQRTVTPSSAKPLFSCSICSMGFDLPKDLRAHTINAHPF